MAACGDRGERAVVWRGWRSADLCQLAQRSHVAGLVQAAIVTGRLAVAPAAVSQFPEAYSSRNTLIGSTFDARRAGIQHAARAIAVSSAATSANVAGSVALTP